MVEYGMILNVPISEQEHKELSIRASKLGIPAEQLVHLLVQDLVSHEDVDFLNAKRRVLEKNAELYKRLS
jgi:hypothetical protein